MPRHPSLRRLSQADQSPSTTRRSAQQHGEEPGPDMLCGYGVEDGDLLPLASHYQQPRI